MLSVNAVALSERIIVCIVMCAALLALNRGCDYSEERRLAAEAIKAGYVQEYSKEGNVILWTKKQETSKVSPEVTPEAFLPKTP